MGSCDWDGVLVCVLAFSLYINTLGHGFVYDDNRAILSNPDVHPSSPLLNVFHNDFWGAPLSSSNSHGSYRPLSVLSFRFNVWLSGLNPMSFHLTNVILHVVATGLVLKTGRVFLHGRSPTLAAALFAVHPIHVEAVAGVVGRADVLATIFYLMSFLFYVHHVKIRENLRLKQSLHCLKFRYPKTNSTSKKQIKTYFLISKQFVNLKFFKKTACFPEEEKFYFSMFLVFSVLAVLSKEPGITVIPLAVSYDILLHLRSKRHSSTMKSVAPSALTSVLAFTVIILVRICIMGLQTPTFSRADNPTAKESSIVTRTLTFLYLPLFNLYLLLYPKTLSFDWSMEAIPKVSSVLENRSLLTSLFYFLLYRFFVHSLHKKGNNDTIVKPLSCKVCLSLSGDEHLTHCRVMNNNNTPQKCICSSYNSQALPRSIAVMVCLAFLILPFIPASNLFFYVGFVVAERVLYLPSVGFCLLIGLGAHVLWTISRRPLVLIIGLIVLASLSGRTLQRNMDWRNEESLYRSATNINPPKAYGNLGSVLSTAGRLQEAEQALRLALQYRPNMADVHYNLGNLLRRQNKPMEAVKSYESAIRYRPTLAIAYENLGKTLEQMDLWNEAEPVYAKCVTLDSEGLKDPRSHEAAKASCMRHLQRVCKEKSCTLETSKILNDMEKLAVREYKDEKSTNVSEMSKKTSISDINYLRTGERNKTGISGEEHIFLRALQKEPDDPSIYVNYGQLLVQQGRLREAASMYVRAAQLAPHQHTLVTSAAVALRQVGKLADAEALYRQACDLKPMDASSHSNLGAILHLQGKYQQAANSYKEALRLAPGDHITLTNLQKLKKHPFKE